VTDTPNVGLAGRTAHGPRSSADLAAIWDEISGVVDVCQRAMMLLARHPLRAAALVLNEQMSDPLQFACLDYRLSHAAELEGLRTLRK